MFSLEEGLFSGKHLLQNVVRETSSVPEPTTSLEAILHDVVPFIILILFACAMHVWPDPFSMMIMDITNITYQCSSLPETSTLPETTIIGEIQLSFV